MIDSKCTVLFRGQEKPYDDYVYIWKVETSEADEEKILDFCKKQLAPREDIPLYSEWRPNIMVGGAKFGDAGYYFRGWCKLERVDNGVYKFTVSEPFAD